MKKKGFTLVELLAVIVVLAIILVIAVPRILDIIKDSKEGSMASSVKLIASKGEQQKIENEIMEDSSPISCNGIAEYDSNEYANCDISFDNGLAVVTLSGKAGGKFEGVTCRGTKEDVVCSDVVAVTNAASTRINTGITPNVDDIEFEIMAKPSTGSWYIFQSRSTSSGSITGIGGSSTNNTITFGWSGTSISSGITRNTSKVYYVKGTAKNGTMTLYVKNVTDNVEDTKTGTYTYSAPTASVYIFGNSQAQYVSAGNKVYYARMKLGGTYVVDYIPYKNGDTVGFYDRVSNAFKPVTNGSLTANIS